MHEGCRGTELLVGRPIGFKTAQTDACGAGEKACKGRRPSSCRRDRPIPAIWDRRTRFFYVGLLQTAIRQGPLAGRQQTFVDILTGKVARALAKLYTTKTPITAADLLNDRVLPFFEEHGMGHPHADRSRHGVLR